MNHYLRHILTSEDDRDPGFAGLVKIVLALAALASLIIAAVLPLTLGRNDLWVLVTTVFQMSILCGISLFLTYRNMLWTGRVLLPVTTDGCCLFDNRERARKRVVFYNNPAAGVAEIPCSELQKVES